MSNPALGWAIFATWLWLLAVLNLLYPHFVTWGIGITALMPTFALIFQLRKERARDFIPQWWHSLPKRTVVALLLSLVAIAGLAGVTSYESELLSQGFHLISTLCLVTALYFALND